MNEQSPAAAAPRHGLFCPKCSTILDRVFFTRPVVNQILRVRKCRGCREVVRTSERIVRAESPEPCETSSATDSVH